MKYLGGQLLALLLSCLCLVVHHVVTAMDVQGTIIRNGAIADLALLPPSTMVVLDNGSHAGYVRQDGSFIIREVSEGDYLLEVWTSNLEFPKLKVSFRKDNITAIRTDTGLEWSTVGLEQPYPLLLAPLAKREFFTKREGFSIIGLFANPYMLMMGFSVIMLVVMPKMMKSMDPEALEEMQQNQSNIQNGLDSMPDISQKLANFFAPTQ